MGGIANQAKLHQAQEASYYVGGYLKGLNPWNAPPCFVILLRSFAATLQWQSNFKSIFELLFVSILGILGILYALSMTCKINVEGIFTNQREYSSVNARRRILIRLQYLLTHQKMSAKAMQEDSANIQKNADRSGHCDCGLFSVIRFRMYDPCLSESFSPRKMRVWTDIKYDAKPFRRGAVLTNKIFVNITKSVQSWYWFYAQIGRSRWLIRQGNDLLNYLLVPDLSQLKWDQWSSTAWDTTVCLPT